VWTHFVIAFFFWCWLDDQDLDKLQHREQTADSLGIIASAARSARSTAWGTDQDSPTGSFGVCHRLEW